MSKKEVRIISGIVLFFVIAMIALASLNKAPPKDLNVYLNEEVRFTDEVFIKVVGLSVEENSEADNDNEEGDLLSEYTLNLIVSITQKNTDLWVNRVTMKSEMFTLKSVNLKAKSKMQVFFNSLAAITLQTTLGMLVGGVVEGVIEYGVLEAIESGIDFAEEYLDQSIENAEIVNTQFKPIKALKDQFEPFKPRENMNEETLVKLSFPISQEYLDSQNIMVLSVDKIDKWERKIFLMPRPIELEEE